MPSVVTAVAILVVAVAIAFWLRRRQVVAEPTQPRSWTVPAQLDRTDFPEAAHAAWMVVVFSSATCDVCASIARKAQVLASPQVAVVEREFTAFRQSHERYGIDAVPTTVIADERGVVRASFVGPVSATDLWAAVAEVREPGSSPEPLLGRAETGE